MKTTVIGSYTIKETDIRRYYKGGILVGEKFPNKPLRLVHMNWTVEEYIIKARDFELAAICDGSSEPNPYFSTIKMMGLWEAVNKAVDKAVRNWDWWDDCEG